MRVSPIACRAAVAAGSIVVLLGCRDTTGPRRPDAVAVVSVTPTAAVLVPGQDVQLIGVARDRSRVALPDEPVSYASSDPDRATVSTTGLVSALSPGRVTITASSGSASAAAQLAIDEGAWIGPAGGIVSAFNGALTLTVPENALAALTAIRVTPPFGTLPLDPTAVGGEFSLRFEAGLAEPAILSVGYALEEGPAGVAESDFGVRRLSVESWLPVPGTVVDPAEHRASAAITASGTYGVGRVPPAASCSGAEHRQFDFWLGRWGVVPTGSGPGVRQASSRITLESGGCAVFEDFQDLGTRGKSVSLFDPVTARWYQTFIDNNGTRLILAGGLVGGAMVLAEADNASRITWSVVGADVRQVGESSDDGGTTWDPGFDLTYLPK